MRVLGLDYGDQRIGVAICDELGMAARGIATLVRKNRDADLAAIAGFVERFGVEKIVIGYPLRLDGSEGIQCDKVNRFARRLEARLSMPIILPRVYHHARRSILRRGSGQATRSEDGKTL